MVFHNTLIVALIVLVFISSSAAFALLFKAADKWELPTITTAVLKNTHHHGGIADLSNGLRPVSFAHPTVQMWIMFLGEALCLVIFTLYTSRVTLLRACSATMNSAGSFKYSHATSSSSFSSTSSSGEIEAIQRQRRASCTTRLLYAIPACLDLLASILLNFAVIFTYVSVAQMLRGGTLIWTMVISRVYLGRRFQVYQWCAIAVCILGLFLVGLSSLMMTSSPSPSLLSSSSPLPSATDASSSINNHPVLMTSVSVSGSQQQQQHQQLTQEEDNAPHPQLGVVLVCLSTFLAALLAVAEERLFRYASPHPFELIGWEGVFGLLMTTAMLLAMHFLFAGRPDDAATFIDQVTVSHKAKVWMFYCVLTSTLNNGCAQFITKYISGATRVVIGQCRTVVVWICGVWLFGEQFDWLQATGFIILFLGTLMFNNCISVESLCCGLVRVAWLAHDPEIDRINAALMSQQQQQQQKEVTTHTSSKKLPTAHADETSNLFHSSSLPSKEGGNVHHNDDDKCQQHRDDGEIPSRTCVDISTTTLYGACDH